MAPGSTWFSPKISIPSKIVMNPTKAKMLIEKRRNGAFVLLKRMDDGAIAKRTKKERSGVAIL